MRLRIGLLALVASSLCGPAAAQEVVHFDRANPPFMSESGGRPVGLYPALFEEAFARMGVEARFAALPWKRALADTDAGRAGTGGIYQNSERLQKYDYSRAYYEERIAVYAAADAGLRYEKLQDLFGKTVGVIRGWSYGDAFDAAVKAGTIKVDEAEDDRTNFKKLGMKRVDAAVAIVEAGDASVRALGLERRVRQLGTYLTVNKVYLAFGKSASKTAVLAAFDRAIATMKKDGTFDAIVKRSLGGG